MPPGLPATCPGILRANLTFIFCSPSLTSVGCLCSFNDPHYLLNHPFMQYYFRIIYCFSNSYFTKWCSYPISFLPDLCLHTPFTAQLLKTFVKLHCLFPPFSFHSQFTSLSQISFISISVKLILLKSLMTPMLPNSNEYFYILFLNYLSHI